MSVEPKEERPDVTLTDGEEARSTPSVIEEEKETADVAPSTPGLKDKHDEEDDDDDEESGLEEQPPSPRKTSEIDEKQDSPKKSENTEQADEKKVNLTLFIITGELVIYGIFNNVMWNDSFW